MQKKYLPTLFVSSVSIIAGIALLIFGIHHTTKTYADNPQVVTVTLKAAATNISGSLNGHLSIADPIPVTITGPDGNVLNLNKKIGDTFTLTSPKAGKYTFTGATPYPATNLFPSSNAKYAWFGNASGTQDTFMIDAQTTSFTITLSYEYGYTLLLLKAVNQFGQPVAGVQYTIHAPDNTTLTDVSSADGEKWINTPAQAGDVSIDAKSPDLSITPDTQTKKTTLVIRNNNDNGDATVKDASTVTFFYTDKRCEVFGGLYLACDDASKTAAKNAVAHGAKAITDSRNVVRSKPHNDHALCLIYVSQSNRGVNYHSGTPSQAFLTYTDDKSCIGILEVSPDFLTGIADNAPSVSQADINKITDTMADANNNNQGQFLLPKPGAQVYATWDKTFMSLYQKVSTTPSTQELFRSIIDYAYPGFTSSDAFFGPAGIHQFVWRIINDTHYNNFATMDSKVKATNNADIINLYRITEEIANGTYKGNGQ